MPSPSNQCASRPKSELVTGLPPLRTYMPPSSSSGIRPVHETGVGGHVVVMGAKLPARYLQGISQGDAWILGSQLGGHAYGCFGVVDLLCGPVLDITAVLLSWRH
jgi:hypothetical protein